jgi:hypothetical protein
MLYGISSIEHFIHKMNPEYAELVKDLEELLLKLKEKPI